MNPPGVITRAIAIEALLRCSTLIDGELCAQELLAGWQSMHSVGGISATITGQDGSRSDHKRLLALASCTTHTTYKLTNKTHALASHSMDGH
jgi:hypothetical protein